MNNALEDPIKLSVYTDNVHVDKGHMFIFLTVIRTRTSVLSRSERFI